MLRRCGRSSFDRAHSWRLLDVRDRKPRGNDGIASSDRVRADDFHPLNHATTLFPSRGLVALDAFHRFRSPNANGVAPSQFDATRSGKDQLTGHSIVRAPLYGRTPVLTKAREQRVARDAVKRSPSLPANQGRVQPTSRARRLVRTSVASPADRGRVTSRHRCS
jgi:hypothetical protein